MHEVQGSFYKTVVLWKNAKITAAGKKHYGPNLQAGLGCSPWAEAQSVEEGAGWARSGVQQAGLGRLLAA